MAPLSAHLLAVPAEGEAVGAGPSVRQSRRWRSVAAAAGVAAAISASLVLFLAGAEPGPSAPRASAVRASSLKALGRSSSPAVSTAWGEGSDSSCYAFTGVTCQNNTQCGGSRNTVCEDSRCMCAAAGCVGMDGVCRPQIYTTVGIASGFRLYNAKWTHQHMYLPQFEIFQRVKTNSVPAFLSLGTDKWVLHEVPVASGPRAYLLSTRRFPDHVASIRPTLKASNPFGAYRFDLSDEDEKLASYAVRFCSLGGGTVKIGSYKKPLEWFYIESGSWIVYGSGPTDPGDEGHWRPSPPIPEDELEPC